MRMVLSNHASKLAQILHALCLEEHIHRIFDSAYSGYEKPHPWVSEVLLKVLDRPERVCMIGDNLNADVRGAEATIIPHTRSRTPRRSDTLGPPWGGRGSGPRVSPRLGGADLWLRRSTRARLVSAGVWPRTGGALY